MAVAAPDQSALHIPVLLRPILDQAAPVTGHWVDGTFGAGGYTRGLLDAGAEAVTAIDQDPSVFDLAAPWAAIYGDRLRLVQANFADMADHAQDVSGVVLDLGVSSMQLDQADRGFSFRHDGPLDMRMSQSGPSAADLVNDATEVELADILFQYGEERASRRIARAIVAARPLTTTRQLAEVIEGCLPRAKPGHSHPATRSFQALRIAVNDEFSVLVQGLEAAVSILAPEGLLAVVTFHSLEDRVVKRFFQAAAGSEGGGNRYAPAQDQTPAPLRLIGRKAIAADAAEVAANPRARSAHLRMARRTTAPLRLPSRARLGLPGLAQKDRRHP